MPRFFTENILWDEKQNTGRGWLTGEDFHHLTRSLRMRSGEAVTLSDGAGTDYFGTLEEITADRAEILLTEKQTSRGEPSVFVTLYAGMPKGDKLELIVQKAVELGVSRIVPVLTARSISRPDKKAADKRRERLARVALEAAKQCGRGRVPEVAALTGFAEAIESAEGKKIFFYEGGGAPLQDCVSTENAEISIFIGPEGGFAAEEVDLAKTHGAITATLGPRILRTETAPLAALSIIMHLTGNME